LDRHDGARSREIYRRSDPRFFRRRGFCLPRSRARSMAWFRTLGLNPAEHTRTLVKYSKKLAGFRADSPHRWHCSRSRRSHSCDGLRSTAANVTSRAEYAHSFLFRVFMVSLADLPWKRFRTAVPIRENDDHPEGKTPEEMAPYLKKKTTGSPS